jgi:ankyrin repeat protein
MFELGEKVAHYTVLHATSVERIKKIASDDHHMRDLKRNLHVLYVGLYKSLLRASAQLTISLYGDWQFVKNLAKHYDWEGQIKELDGYHKLCNDYRDEMIARQKDMSLAEAEQQKATGLALVSLKPKKGTDFVSPPHDKEKAVGPGPRNPLHWAVALGVSEQVTYFVQKEEYAINAFTPKRWTVAHLAAEQGSTKIMKTLLTVPGLDLRIENNDGRTALHIAALHNKVGVLKLLLQRDKQLLGRRDGRGRTAFLLAAQKGHVKILTALKEQGQDFNDATATNGWTALHFAAEGGHADTVQYLLANSSNKATKVKAGNSKGLTARQVAEQKKKLKIVAILQG